MSFSVEQWQREARQKYAELASWLKGRRTPAGLLAYGGLTTFTLWPLVEYVSAAAQAGQPLPLPAIMALGTIAGGVGGNLLASQIQNWYEAATRDEAPDEAVVLAWLAEHAVAKQDLQPVLDQILEALQAIPQAHDALASADWHPFFAQLQSDMQQIGNSARFEAQLIGDGLIIQGDDNIVAGRVGLVLQGDVGELIMDQSTQTVTHKNQYGDVVYGDKVGGDQVAGDKITVAGDLIQQTDPTQVDQKALREAYLGLVLGEHNRLLLGGIDPKVVTADKERLRLSAVYTALLTESTEADHLGLAAEAREDPQKRPRRLAALQQLNRQRHLVLLGDPGSGKSTFVNFVAVCLAGEGLADETLNLDLLTTPLPEEDNDRLLREDTERIQAPQPWNHGALLPACITLREFAARGLPPAGQKATAVHLWDFVATELHAAGLGQYAPFLQREMLEKGGLFLFDGLDEVPASDQYRLQIKQVVEDIARTCRRSRVLVTSRTYAYQKQDWRLPGFTETVLAPFSEAQIGHFVDRWYEQMVAVGRFNKEDAGGRAALLKGAIFGSKRLSDLAERPLLLTLMASLHAWRGGSLPQKREQLYADAVALLLDIWEQQRIMRAADGAVQLRQPSLEQWLKVDREKVRGLLDKLAFEGHQKQPDTVGTADIPGADLVMGLLALSADQSLQPAQLVDYLSNRAGLLLPRGQDIYTFPHRTFQEYLAACHLTGPGYPAQVANLARGEPNRWREVTLLAGAKAARGSAYALWGLVQELCFKDPAAGEVADYWGAHLAGQLICETADLNDLTPAQQPLLARVRHWLLRLLREPLLPAAERALAGRHLAQLGDPRPEVLDVDAMQFCLVPAGDFWLDEGEQASLVSFLDYDFCLARFPVTVAQYETFVADQGYANQEWWPEAIAAGLWRQGAYTAYGQRRTEPWDVGAAFRWANLPVVGVSWFEALAFTRWLAARWRAAGWLPAGWQVTLPSEAEWEKAARGGVQIPEEPQARALQDLSLADPAPLTLRDNLQPSRRFTWSGNKITPEMANYGAGEINRTSTVGSYAAAASVYGCEEILGNVLEWTRSLYKSYPYDPADGREQLARRATDRTVLRGGSWAASERYARCAYRYGVGPNLGYDRYYGFRVVVSPLLTSEL